MSLTDLGRDISTPAEHSGLWEKCHEGVFGGELCSLWGKCFLFTSEFLGMFCVNTANFPVIFWNFVLNDNPRPASLQVFLICCAGWQQSGYCSFSFLAEKHGVQRAHVNPCSPGPVSASPPGGSCWVRALEQCPSSNGIALCPWAPLNTGGPTWEGGGTCWGCPGGGLSHPGRASAAQ